MSADRQSLLDQVLAMPVPERADFAADVLASLPGPDGDIEVDSTAWVTEVERRARRVFAGESTSDDWDAAERRILIRLAEE